MICESCQQNLATVHLTEIVQKQKRETHLCEDCARNKGVPHQEQPFSVKGFLEGIDKEPASEGEGEGAQPAAAQQAPEPCPACGITFAEFRSTGRLGCHFDYEHFQGNLRPLLEKIHGRTQHRGRMPSRIGERLERDRLLASYQRELSDAVEREEYERAAELRDKLRELEGRKA